MDKLTPIKKPATSAANSAGEISTGIASRLLGLCQRQINRMCRDGNFKTAHKPGGGKFAHWRIQRGEVISRKYNPLTNRDIYE